MPISTCSIANSNILWTDLVNPSQDELQQIARKYNLNSYTLRDSLDPDHLPKYEEHNDTHFIILRILHEDVPSGDASFKELSSKIAIFYNHDFIITIHHAARRIVETIDQIKAESDEMKSTTAIVIKLVKEVLHTYEIPAMKLSDDIDSYESKLFFKKKFPEYLIEKIYFLKSRVGTYKKLLLLTNEVVNAIRADNDDKPAMRDAHDLHTKLMMLYDQIQDEANNLLNIYLSLLAQKTNDVMKILTIFSVFFMPLTFIVGVYGMNFKYMPELSHRWGYPLTILAMVIVCLVVFIWFKRKRWI